MCSLPPAWAAHLRAQLLSRQSREAGLLTRRSDQTFKFEANAAWIQANSGIKELLTRVDSLLIIPMTASNLRPIKVTLANAFEMRMMCFCRL